MAKMRIAIREQLAALVIFTVLVSLAIVSIPTWIYVNSFVVGVESDGLALTASLKAARIASEINLVQTTCQTIATRLLLQKAFIDFYNQTDTNSSDAFADARRDLQSAMSYGGVSGLLQARLFSRNTTGNPKGLLNVTGSGIGNQTDNIELPYLAPDGSRANLSDSTYGYPPMLYPNITYQDLGYPNPFVPSTNAYAANAFPDVRISTNGGLLLGPLVINETYALLSITIPVRSNDQPGFILGYMTLVASAQPLVDIQMSREGLGSTGVVLMIGSTNVWNRFNNSLPASNATLQAPLEQFESQDVHFILPPMPAPSQTDRHAVRSFATGGFQGSFALREYPIALDVLHSINPKVNNATSLLSSTNEQRYSVAVGAARPQTSLATWAVVVEQDHSEAYAPIEKLRRILLGCVFGTAGLVLVLIIPCAHFSVQPIRRLKSATEKSILPPGYEDEFGDDYDDENPSSGGTLSQLSEKGIFAHIKRRIKKRRRARARAEADRDASSSRRVFKIPRRVQDRKHYVTDELTELTETFNEMTDELFKQYTLLDEKVAERTKELEISKKAAEAANESKTLFIANISHELKTPLNGIMGMCAVCMEEDDIARIKQSLKTLYKSGKSFTCRRVRLLFRLPDAGDLLLHLLEDLLSFSKNQIGQQVSLEEREFRMGDVRSQIISIFDKQVRENRINFTVSFVGSDSIETTSPDRVSTERPRLPALGPLGTGRLKDMCLWGDQHRILQVIINLVSNSLKFTPAGGKVELRIRCVGEQETVSSDDSRASSFSNRNSDRPGRSRHRVGSGSTVSTGSKATSSAVARGGTAIAINPLDDKATPHIHIRERSPTPPPPNAKSYIFEFQVEDTGPGIAEHMQEKIFEPFVQGDLGLSKKFGGTGLGLSICAQLAKLMGGSITLRSTVGVGTTFTMQIPLKYVKDR
jgi:osomolarity two-component system sensor histidine kinase SLN1